MDITKQPFRVGDIVAYEDMANPREIYVVDEVDLENPWNTYRLYVVGEGDYVYSDCRQRGWTLVERASEVAK